MAYPRGLYGRLNPDTSHPYRQPDTVKEVKASEGCEDQRTRLLSVKRTHGTDANPLFLHQPRVGSPLNSDQFIAWLVEELSRDEDFFANTRAHYASRRTT